MALTFQELTDLLKPVDGKLEVAGSAFQTAAVESLFEGYLAGGKLSLTGAAARPDEQTRTVHVDGTLEPSTLLALKTVTVTDAAFRLRDDGSVHALVPAAVPEAGWPLAKAFPDLAGGAFDGLTCTNAVLTLDSDVPHELPPGFRQSFGYAPDEPAVADALAKGLYLEADLGFAGAVETAVGVMFDMPSRVHGPVELFWQADADDPEKSSPAPQLLLETEEDPGRTLRFGSYTLAFRLQVAALLQEFKDPKEEKVSALPAGLLAVHSELRSSTTDPFPISLLVYEGEAARLVFNAGAVPSGDFDAGKLPGLLDGTSMGKMLDPGQGFPLVESLRLTNASIALATQPPSVESITLALDLVPTGGHDDSWSVFDLIDVTDIGFRIGVSRRGGALAPHAAMFADAHLHGNEDVKLEAYASLPDLQFGCSLAETKPVDLTQTVKDLIGTAIPLGTLTGASLAISGNPKTSIYTLQAAITEHWRIVGNDRANLTLEGFQLALTKAPSGVSGMIGAKVELAGRELSLTANYDPKGWTFVGATLPGDPIDLTELVRELGEMVGVTLPPGLPTVDLSELRLEYATAGGGALELSATVKLPQASFDLTSLPLVGPHLDPADKVVLGDIALTIGHADGATTSKLAFSVALGKTDSIAVEIPLSGPKTPAPPAAALQAGEAPTYPVQGSGTFLQVQRTFGPVRIEKLGFTLDEGGLGVQVYGSITVAGAKLEILGLEAKVPLKAPFDPSFDIRGLGVSYSASAVKLSGGLLKVGHTGYDSYDGMLTISAEAISLAAFASYATTDPPSMFAFVMADIPIGGPPFFFVTGVAGGFGVNRNLLMPPIDQVDKFPLVAGASKTGNPFGENPSFDKYVEVMEKYMGVAIGEDWLAAGLEFTSFELLDSYALLTVAFGTRVQIGLLGLTQLSLPAKAPEPVAQAQLAIEAVWAPDDGVLSVLGQLTPQSYVLAKECHLTGGFAFCLWSAPSKYAGDFVATLGGYHPQFTKPENYPAVPRLGIDWNVKDSPLTIKGGAYFALTPHAVMAGGSLDATWESGPIKVWFNAYADFLIQWQPFHYDVRMGVSFGVKATLNIAVATVTISVSVGAALHLWGPEFTGEARIDLSVVSFTIGFGAGSSQKPDPVLWDDFKGAFLRPSSNGALAAGPTAAEEEPGATALVAVQDGMLADVRRESAPVDYVVDPQKLVLGTRSLVPARTIVCNGEAVPVDWNDRIAIGPMAVPAAELTSEHAITILRDGTPSGLLAPVPNTAPAPKALWAPQGDLTATLNDPAQLDRTAHGTTLVPVGSEPDHSLPVDVQALLYDQAATEPWSFGTDVAPTTDPWGGDDPWTELAETVNDRQVGALRTEIAWSLIANGASVTPAFDLEPFVGPDGPELLDPPVLHYLGERPAVGP